MRTAPACIGWAALAAALAGCCRMQLPSAADTLSSEWTRVGEAGPVPAPGPVPEPVTARPTSADPAPAAPSGSGPASTVPVPEAPPRPPVAAVPFSYPGTLPLQVPPARGEPAIGEPQQLALATGAPGTSAAVASGTVELRLGDVVAPGAKEGLALPLRVGSADAPSPQGATPPLAVPFAAPPVPSPAHPVPSSSAAPLAIGSAGGSPASAGQGLPSPVLAPSEGSLVRRDSFLPPLKPGVPPPTPSSRGPSALAAVAAPPGVGAGLALPIPPPPPSPPPAATAPSPAIPPGIARSPAVAASAVLPVGEVPLPSRAFERAEAADPAREDERRSRDLAAWREREAEAGVLRRFLRRVLRLEPTAEEPAPDAADPVSDEPR